MGDVATQVRAALEAVFRGRRIVLVGGPVAGATPRVQRLRDLGAERCLVIGAGPGTGPAPTADEADVVCIEMPAAEGLVGALRDEERVFASPPGDVREAIDRFDSARNALVLAPPYSAINEVCGRRLFGARRPEWVALEDKTRFDAVFADAGVPVPASQVVTADLDACRPAARMLDRGEGTVWAGDARDGYNGGAMFVRWVRDDGDAREAIAWFQDRCDRVRITRFVEGIPCSVHGFVTDDGVAALRPVELVTLRSPTAPRFRYAGAATFWDPPTGDREVMRRAVRALGAQLRDRVRFRGAFTLDGILSADGFVATECNPRFGAGLGYVSSACPDLGFDLFHHAVIEGHGAGVTAQCLEEAILPAADASRWGGAWTGTATVWTESSRVAIVEDGDGYRAADAGEAVDGWCSYGPGPVGGFVRVEFEASRMSTGASIADHAVEAFAFADAYCGARIGPLTAARAMR